MTPRNDLLPQMTPRNDLLPQMTPQNEEEIPQMTPRNDLLPQMTPQNEEEIPQMTPHKWAEARGYGPRLGNPRGFVLKTSFQFTSALKTQGRNKKWW